MGVPSKIHFVPPTVSSGEEIAGSSGPSCLIRPSLSVSKYRITRARIGVGAFVNKVTQSAGETGSDMFCTDVIPNLIAAFRNSRVCLNRHAPVDPVLCELEDQTSQLAIGRAHKMAAFRVGFVFFQSQSS